MREPGSKRGSRDAGRATVRSRSVGRYARSLVLRLLLTLLGWWIISEGQAPGLGLAAAVAAAGLSLWLAPPTRRTLRPLGALTFFGYFLLRSCVASIDVAVRIVHPRLPLSPFITHVPLTLPPGPPRLLLVDTLNLLPGTLSVAQQGDKLVLHCLSRDSDAEAAVQAMEARIAALFGLPAGGAA